MNDIRVLRTGKGRSIAQHGELFQGQIEDERGELHRCLVSLPCRVLHSEASFQPDESGTLQVSPSHKCKAQRVVQLTLAYLDVAAVGGKITIKSAVPEAKGCGSSTADCIAAAKAVADALGIAIAEEEMARLVVEAEVASDNFMFSRAVLFAHREGTVLEDYAAQLPSIEVLGIDTAPEGRVETLKFPAAEYSHRQLQSFCTLTGALRRALRCRDVRLLGRVATASANINQEFLPKAMYLEIRRIAESIGALGVAIAHSGTVLSILLDRQDELLEWRIERIQAEIRVLGISKILRFQT